MTYKKISVLLPTRKRINFLSKMLESYNETVDNPEDAELIFRCDSDDSESIEYLRQLPHKIIIGPRQKGYRSLPGFYNEMAGVSSGDLLMCCNDDVIFKTKGWARLLFEEAEKYPDGIFNFGVNVGLNDDKFPFSIVSKKLVDTLGFINDTRLLFSDVFLLDVAKYFNRAIRVHTVTIFHDWAGHGDDETRRDANKHEFDMVFKDATGAWSDRYADLHYSVVAEAVEKIKKGSAVYLDSIIESLSQYTPPQQAEASANGEIWLPRVSCKGWNNDNAPNAIHYSKREIRALLEVLFDKGITGGEIFLSHFKNGLPNIFWGKVFDRVFSIYQGETNREPIEDDKNTILFGSLGDTKFMYKVMDRIAGVPPAENANNPPARIAGVPPARVSNLRAILFDEVLYSHIISPYFLLKKLIKPPGIIIFFNSNGKVPQHEGAHRFVNDLRRGYLDNRRHEVVDLVPVGGGNGVSFEIIRTDPPSFEGIL